MYYIAYGSNLSVDQMAYRCPDARPIGIASLNDYKLVFRTHATVEPAPGKYVPVVVWEISEADERNLDRYEGFPVYYRKESIDVTMQLFGKTQKISGMVYIMNNIRPVSPPALSYYRIIEEGYAQFGFKKNVLDEALRDSMNHKED